MPATTTEPASKRGRKSSPRRTKKISVEEAEREREEAIKAALEKQREELEAKFEQEQAEQDFGYSDFDAPEDEEEERGFTGSIFGGQNAPTNDEGEVFDIFTYTAKEYEARGKPVTYHIKRDNEVVGQLPAPCDWGILQRKYGGGIFQVVARDANNGQYFKSQTQRIAEPPKRDEDKQQHTVIQQPQQPAPDMNQMFNGLSQMFLQMQEMASKEKNREERDDKKANSEFNSTFLTLITNQQKQASDMMMKLAEMNNSTAKTQSDNFSKVIEKMDDKFSKMFEKLADAQNKKESIGTMDLIKIMNESRKEGSDTMANLLEMAEALAEARGGESDSKESLLGTLVKGFAPLLAQANKSMAHAQQRGAVHQQPSALPQAPRSQNPGPNRAAQNIRLEEETSRRRSAQENRAGGGKKDWRSSLGLSTITDEENSGGSDPIIPQTLQGKEFIEREVAEPISPVDNQENEAVVDRDASDLYQNASPTQKLIAEIAIPTIIEHLFNDDVSASDVGHICLAELASQGVTAEIVLKEFSFDFLLEIAASFNMNVEVDKRSWFEEFYATIQDSARVEPIGEEESALN